MQYVVNNVLHYVVVSLLDLLVTGKFEVIFS